LKFIKKATKHRGRPKVIVTDGLRSYCGALKDFGAADRQETGKWLNNGAENPTSLFDKESRRWPASTG
jgi:putative transposase